MRRIRGFTLIELMIVVGVVAILASIAVPIYNEQIRKSRRADAKQVLADYALREEKWRTNNATYGTLANINGVATPPPGNYTIAITFPTAGNCPPTPPAILGPAKDNRNSFIITATAAAAQLKDTNCATLVFTNNCGTAEKTSTPAGKACW